MGLNETVKPKHVDHHQSHQAQAQPKVASAANPFKALSPNCVVQVSSTVPAFGQRAKITKEEIDAINNGGNEVSDWRKCKI